MSLRPRGSPVLDYAWERPRWVDWSVAEQRATREAVAVFDQTSFSKYLVAGPGRRGAPCSGCAPPTSTSPWAGRSTPAMLNRRGTYEADLTVTRTVGRPSSSSSAAPRRRCVTSTGSAATCPPDARVGVVDVTGAYAVFGVMGPRSRELLEALSPTRFDDASFPFGTSREVRRSGRPRCAPPGSPTWASWAGSSTCPTELAPQRSTRTCSAPARDLGVVPGRLLRDRVDAAGEGLPRLRPRAHHRDRAGRGRADLRVQAAQRRRLPRPGRRGGARERSRRRAGGVARGRRPRGIPVGWRAGAARRRARPGR